MDFNKMSAGVRFSLLALAILLVGTTAAFIGSQQNTDTRSRASVNPITFVGKNTKVLTSQSSSISIDKPAGVTSGDVMVAHVNAFHNGTTININPPAGWTLVRRDTSSYLSAVVYYRVATASEPTSYAWSFAKTSSPTQGYSTSASGGIGAYRNVDQIAPIDDHSGQLNSGSTMVAPSVTATTPTNHLLFFGASLGNNYRSSGSVISVTPPAGMTTQWMASTQYYSSTHMSDQALTTAGATGAKTGSINLKSGYKNIGQLIALKPISSGPTATPTLVPPTATTAPTPTPIGPTVIPTPTSVPTAEAPVLCPECNFATFVSVGNRLSGHNFTNAFFPAIFAPNQNLSNSNFTGVAFNQAVLTGTNMTNSNFTNADFTSADLNGATTTGATFTGAIWNNTTCPDGTNSNANGGTCVGHL